MNWKPRIATQVDISQLEELIPRSSLELHKKDYTYEQIRAALGPVFGVDRQLIEDGTYFVVEDGAKVIGCGGWSFRQSNYGGSASRVNVDPKLDPKTDPARIRAFFIDPEYTRKGVGSAIMRECEKALMSMGFTYVEISATLVGEPFYAQFGYKSVERFQIPLEGAKPMISVKMIKRMN